MIRYFLAILLAGSFFAAKGQNLSQHNWYFGNSNDGIRFDRATNVAKLIGQQSLPFGTGGSAVATDPASGNLLFYTDGIRVYDALHLAMPNGNGLLGNNAANQPAVICPVPGQADKYFIFTNNANYKTGGTITYSVVDLNQLGNAASRPGLGGIEGAKKNLSVGLATRSEGMIIIPHTNGTGYWLISHQNSTATYSCTLITTTSYHTGNFPTTNFTNLGAHKAPISVGHFSYNHKLKKIAVSTQNERENALILDFNPTTGIVSFDRYILNTGIITATSQSLYDIQWDIKGGQYLYISRIGEPGIAADVLQYDYTNSDPNIPSSLLSSIYRTPSIYRSYGLQLAPDSTIYHLYQATPNGPFLVEKISQTESIASQVKTTQPFGTTDFKGMQFPAFLPQSNANLSVDFTNSSPTCQNSPITFFPDVRPNADSLVWNFGDNSQTVKAWSPMHTYTSSGSFQVTTTAYYQGQKKTSVPKTISIAASTLKLSLVSDTTACRSEFPPKRGNTTDPNRQFQVNVTVTQGTANSFTWSNGNTGQILKPDSAGYYYVIATDGSGCSAYAGVTIREYGLSDQRSNVWYFGNKAGIDFNVNPPQALTNSIMNAPAGCATMCDRNGKMIFYTDGSNVYDKTHTLIETGIGGDPLSTQSSLIVPVVKDETLYYIFTTQAINGTSFYELRYSLFDLKQNNGRGAITKKNILLFSKSTERITASGKWLIAHEYGNNIFRSYKITPQGLSGPVYSEIGSSHSYKTPENGQGYMKLGIRNNLAVPISTPGTSNILELFQLDTAKGTINNYRKTNLNEPDGQMYGLEFSAQGRKLFVTIRNTPAIGQSKIVELYLDSLDKADPLLIQKVAKSMDMGALQIAPNGLIYLSLNNSSNNHTLGSVQAEESKDPKLLSTFNFTSFPLASSSNSRLGLPNLIQREGTGYGGPDFTFAQVCLGTTTHFNGIPTDKIDLFQWSFGDGSGSTLSNPKHLYTAQGNYIVTMRLTNRCGLDVTIKKNILISEPPKPTNKAVELICTNPVVINAGPQAITPAPNPAKTYSYLWSNGATTKTISSSTQETISVTVTDIQTGCKGNATTKITSVVPVVDIGPDEIVCQNQPLELDSKNNALPNSWSVTEGTLPPVIIGSSSKQSVNTNTPKVFTYKVTVTNTTNPGQPCQMSDSKVVTINPIPVFTLSAVNPTACNTATGTVTLNITPTLPNSGPYSYYLSGTMPATSGTGITAPFNTGALAGVSAGTVSATVVDQISGCTHSDVVSLSDAPFTATATFTNCIPSNVQVNPVGGTAPYQYTFTNASTGTVTGPQPTNTATLPPGNYSIMVRDNNGVGCTLTFTQLVNPTSSPTLTITPSFCSNPATLTAFAAGSSVSYSWNTPTTTSTGATTTITTSGRYLVTAVIPGGCTLTQFQDIIYNGPFSPNFSQSDGCSSQVQLTTTPTGNYSYRWFKSGVVQPNLLGSDIVLDTSEDGSTYSVEVTDVANNCTSFSPSKTIQVTGVVDASLSTTQSCDDNKPFTITTTTSATSPTFTWFYNDARISGQTNSTLTDTRAGIYKVTVRKATCNASADIQIIKFPLPQGQLPDKALICNDPENHDPKTSTVNLNPGNFITYNWFKNNVALNHTTSTYLVNSGGIYEVEITNAQGCTSKDKTEVFNECIPKIVGPNVFRPASIQNDNQNFFIYSFFVTDNFDISIFNRWGELIFHSKDRKFKWNGGYQNNLSQPMPGGTYSYIIHYESSFHPEDGIKEQRGGVVLLR